MADALANIGAIEYLGTLWNALRREKSPVLRRQIAHAMATLLAPGPDAYSLIALSGDARSEKLIRFLNQHFGGKSTSWIDEKPGENEHVREASAEAVLSALQGRDFGKVVRWSLEWISPLERSPVARLLRMIDQIPDTEISEEEALIALLAAARIQKAAKRRTEDRGARPGAGRMGDKG